MLTGTRLRTGVAAGLGNMSNTHLPPAPGSLHSTLESARRGRNNRRSVLGVVHVTCTTMF